MHRHRGLRGRYIPAWGSHYVVERRLEEVIVTPDIAVLMKVLKATVFIGKMALNGHGAVLALSPAEIHCVIASQEVLPLLSRRARVKRHKPPI
jgi:hypothetical protein